jgi:hypothetical protein
MTITTLALTPDQASWFVLALLVLGTVSPRAAFLVAALVALFYVLGRIIVS